MKICSKCKINKPFLEYGKDKRTLSGKKSACRECDRISSNKYYSVNKQKCIEKTNKWRIKNPDKYRKGAKRRDLIYKKAYRAKPENQSKIKARRLLNNAIRSGKVKRLPCEVCGSLKSEGHHVDYIKPFDIKFLCSKHHAEIHILKESERSPTIKE